MHTLPMSTLEIALSHACLQEARILMNNKTEMTMDDLKEVLLENEVTNFDPVAEAFKVCMIRHAGCMFMLKKSV